MHVHYVHGHNCAHNLWRPVSSSNLLLACLLQSKQNRGVGVYKVFNPTVLTLLFYRINLCFPLDVRRTKNKQRAAHFFYYNKIRYFIFYNLYSLDTDSFSFNIFKRLYHTSSKLNIVIFLSSLPPGSHKPIEGLTVHPDPQLHFLSIQNADFFPSWFFPSMLLFHFLIMSFLMFNICHVHDNTEKWYKKFIITWASKLNLLNILAHDVINLSYNEHCRDKQKYFY